MSFNENTVTKVQQKNAQKAIRSVMNGFRLENPPSYVIKGFDINEEIAKLEYKKFGKNGREIKKIDREIKSIKSYSQNFVKVIFEFNDYFLKKMVYMTDLRGGYVNYEKEVISNTPYPFQWVDMDPSVFSHTIKSVESPHTPSITPCYVWTGVLDFPIPSSFIFGRVCKKVKHGGGEYYFAPFKSAEFKIVIAKLEKITPNFFPYEIIESSPFIDLFGSIKHTVEAKEPLRIKMQRYTKYNRNTSPLVNRLNQKKDLIKNMKKIPHFGTTLNRDQMPSFVLKHVSEIDVSTVFIPYKEVSYFQIEQFSYPSMQHCRAIRTLLNYLEEIYSKKIIVKREERDFLDEILYYYLEGNKGKKFTVQAIFNRKNELGLNKQLQSEITLNMINEFLEALEKKNKILSEQKGSEKYYFC